ncbi:trimethylamine methyltransferase family protein [Candidatus Hecatella orcuttiae]|jgi:trimethylamine--corrinoid protein Co-methyltransferase|uniref:trimethylamine methyltransferase family protein n=1 Tax=Candidatus Hecatella orcuttiae TaxID=1935119 RepID=UPI0028682398|nr:trimethylamine methyltransferase family protein [Candidatus Hecatella orcuttiae]
MQGIRPLYGRVVEPLSSEEVYDIHQATLEVLETVGMRIENEEALKIMSGVGAEVDFQKQVVRISSHIVKEMVKKAPHRFTLYGRSPKNEVTLGTRQVYLVNGYGAPNILDMDTGRRRPTSREDLANIIRILDALKYPHMVMTEAIPQDIPGIIADRYIVETLLNNTGKHLIADTYDAEGARDIIKMCEAVVGGEAELRKKPILSCQESLTSPLIIGDGVAGGIVEFSKEGLPVTVWTLPQAGGTAPATLAGTLVVQNAELLAGLTLAQATRAGTRTLIGSFAAVLDQRYACFASGGPEMPLMVAASAQLARYYDVPYIGTAGATESKISDIQAGFEKAASILFSTLSGADVVHGALSGWVDSLLASSYPQILLNHEICELAGRILQGIEVNEDTLAVDIIKEIGIGGNFIKHKHTKKYFRQEQWMPQLSDRTTREEWEQGGGKDLFQVAKEKVKEILSVHQPEPLDKEAQAKIREIVKAAERKHS